MVGMTAEGLREFHYSNSDFEKVRELIYKRAGIKLADSKKQLVYSRLARRLRALEISKFVDYLTYLEANEEEFEEFVNALTTNLTAFYREPHHFDILKRIAARHKLQKRPLRVWCSAASTGEEPYSIAMSLVEAFNSWTPPVEIIASDIDSNVLKHASQGVYDLNRIDGLSQERRKKFFQRGKGSNSGKARVVPDLRALIEYQKINLLDAKWELEGVFDVIFCRNVMIYFDKDTQLKILEKMTKFLKHDGFYIAGHSESFTHAGRLVRLVGKTTYVLSGSGVVGSVDEI